MTRISRGAPAKGSPPKGSWGDGYVIENTYESKRISCRHCLHYCEDDKSCSALPIYVPENGYGYWRKCKKFVLSPEFNNTYFRDRVEKMRGTEYIMSPNLNLCLEQKKFSAARKKGKKKSKTEQLNNKKEQQIKRQQEIEELWDKRLILLRNVVYVCVTKKINFEDIWKKLHFQLDSKGKKRDEFPLLDEETYNTFSELAGSPLLDDKDIINKMAKMLIDLLYDRNNLLMSGDLWDYSEYCDEENMESITNFWFGVLQYWHTEDEFICIKCSNEVDGIIVDYNMQFFSFILPIYGKELFYIQNTILEEVFFERLNYCLWKDKLFDTCYPRTLRFHETIVPSKIYRCLNNNHEAKQEFLTINILLPNGEIVKKTVRGTYCSKCKKVYVLDKDINMLKREGSLLCRIAIDNELEDGLDKESSDYPYLLIQKKVESYGYRTGIRDKTLTDIQRTTILDYIVTQNVESAYELVRFLNWLITKTIVESRDIHIPDNILRNWRYDREFLKHHKLYKK